MNEIKSATACRRESYYGEHGKLNLRVIEAMLGLRCGSHKDAEKAETLKSSFGDKLYPEIVYNLLHKIIIDIPRAKQLIDEILAHKKSLESLLARDVGLEIAALDYARNIKSIVEPPVILGADKMLEIAKTANRDELTGALDKSMLFIELGREIERVKRYGSFFSLILIDVDGLKRINEAFGHETGDAVLKSAFNQMNRNLRAVDSVYRFGGDEFMVILPNSSIESAAAVAKKLMLKIRENRVPLEDENRIPLSVTACMGVESFSYRNVFSVPQAIQSINRLMYEAKKTGKGSIKVTGSRSLNKGIFDVEAKVAEKITEKARFVISGTAINPGIAFGRVYSHEDVLDKIVPVEITPGEVDAELSRVKQALEQVKSDLEEMQKQIELNLGRNKADIFLVHSTILCDPMILAEMEDALRREKIKAEAVVRNVFKRIESRFRFSDNKLAREKCFDIADLGRRVVYKLMGMSAKTEREITPNSVVIAKNLLPSESVRLKRDRVCAIVTETGSRNSHAAILAGGLGIPYISDTEYPVSRIKQSCTVLVDADRGRLIVNPSRQDKRYALMMLRSSRQENADMIKKYRDMELIAGNRRIKVLANVSTPNSIDEAVRYGCSGIGLFRMEQLYMQSMVFPTREQLYESMKELFKKSAGFDITVRLLDIGGDKALPYFDFLEELRSPLGIRGVRVLLRYPKILQAQLLSILELSRDYKVRILIPMVTLPEELAAVRKHLERCKAILKQENRKFDAAVKVGPLIEVPAAVSRLCELLKYSDFINIGTNDLIQYIMAYSRENAAGSRYNKAGTEIAMNYIKDSLWQAKQSGIDCTVCGELAGNTAYTDRFIDMGLENFSVIPVNILKLKARIAQIIGSHTPPRAETRHAV